MILNRIRTLLDDTLCMDKFLEKRARDVVRMTAWNLLLAGGPEIAFGPNQVAFLRPLQELRIYLGLNRRGEKKNNE